MLSQWHSTGVISLYMIVIAPLHAALGETELSGKPMPRKKKKIGTLILASKGLTLLLQCLSPTSELYHSYNCTTPTTPDFC